MNRFKGVNVYYSDNNGLNWYYVGYTEGNSMSIIGNVEVGSTYKVCVTSVSYDSQETAKVDSPTAQITITGNTTLPNNVSNFAYTFLNEIVFAWDKNPNIDLAGYEIRTEDANWGSAESSAYIQGLGKYIHDRYAAIKKSRYLLHQGLQYVRQLLSKRTVCNADKRGSFYANHSGYTVVRVCKDRME